MLTMTMVVLSSGMLASLGRVFFFLYVVGDLSDDREFFEHIDCNLDDRATNTAGQLQFPRSLWVAVTCQDRQMLLIL